MCLYGDILEVVMPKEGAEKLCALEKGLPGAQGGGRENYDLLSE